MLSLLRSLTGLPQQIGDGIRTTEEITRRLAELQRILSARLGGIDQGVQGLAGVLPAVAAEVQRVRETVEPQQERVAVIEAGVLRLEQRLADLAATLELLRQDVDSATDLLPDPDAPGPLARAREAIAGG
jgi:chromosome segregation ATPase